MGWVPLDHGATIGQRGSENGIIVRDEEHELGARVTLEHGGDIAPFAITCGVYGWMVHTRYFRSEAEAAAEFERMKDGLNTILGSIPRVDDPEAEAKCALVSEAISAFVKLFP